MKPIASLEGLLAIAEAILVVERNYSQNKLTTYWL
jgi:hypothetical protein